MGTTLLDDLNASLQDNHLPCAVAWQLAQKHNVSRKRVGETADELKVRIVNCQLGCFGVSKATHDDLDKVALPEALTQEIKAVLSPDGYLLCETAFKVAKKMKVAPRSVGDAASKMKLHIRSCQLGCF